MLSWPSQVSPAQFLHVRVHTLLSYVVKHSIDDRIVKGMWTLEIPTETAESCNTAHMEDGQCLKLLVKEKEKTRNPTKHESSSSDNESLAMQHALPQYVSPMLVSVTSRGKPCA